MQLRILALLTVVLSLGGIPIGEAAESEPKSDALLAEEWVFNQMAKVAPPGRKLWYPDSEETKAEAEARYRSIAKDIVEVVYDPGTKVPFKGKQGRTRTVSLILAVMFHESGFMRHVDYGLGKYARGDQGNSWCMMQLNIGQGRTLKWNRVHDRAIKWNDPKEEISEGLTGEELIQDRKDCIREGLKILRVSLASCKNQPPLLGLAVYASGKCTSGHEESKLRMGTAIRIFNSKGIQRQFQEVKVVPEVVARLRVRARDQEALAKKNEKNSAAKVASTVTNSTHRAD